MRTYVPGVARTVALFACLSGLTGTGVQEGFRIRDHYVKSEHRIPMRDGVRLFTSVYAPTDTSRTYPIILRRTPYGVAPYGPDAYLEAPDRQCQRHFEDGYIIVFQDVRGRYLSEGEFVNVRPYVEDKKGSRAIDETTDTYDTVDWLVKNVRGNNGRVGISGVSYPGFYSSMGAIDAHPAVKAVSPQAPVSKWMAGDDFFHNGAFLLSHAFDFFVDFGVPRPSPVDEAGPRFDHKTRDGYQFFLSMGPIPNANDLYMKNRVEFWNEILRHGRWDRFWEARDILPRLRGIKPAMLVVGGWYDTENLYGALQTYAAIEQHNPSAFNVLVMGPWSHGQWSANEGRRLGDIDFGSTTSDYYTEQIEAPFFDAYLKDQGKADLAEATVFETGANEWRRFPSWPPRDATIRDLLLQPDGSLVFDVPGSASRVKGSATEGCREYVSDPDKPVPYTAEIVNWYNPAFMLEDQRFAARRPDVLVYEGKRLAEDVRVAGPITATLYVSTTGTDADWVVKLIDVLPEGTPPPVSSPRNTALGGCQMLVRGDVLRGKFRASLASPEPFKPNAITKVEFVLQDVFHRFQAGHRLMVQVQSSWFPMVDRNPQTFVDIYAARPGDFRKATHRVCSSGGARSLLKLLVLP